MHSQCNDADPTEETDLDDATGEGAPPESSEGPAGMDAIGDDPVRDPDDESGPGGMNAIPPSRS